MKIKKGFKFIFGSAECVVSSEVKYKKESNDKDKLLCCRIIYGKCWYAEEIHKAGEFIYLMQKDIVKAINSTKPDKKRIVL